MKSIPVKITLITLLALLPQMVAAAGWQWIAPQRAYSMLKEGSGLWLVDVRSEAAYAEGHPEGAMSIPAAAMATRRLPQGKVIVLVDDSLGLRKGREAAEILEKKGNDRVFLLDGGMPAWQREGYPVTGRGGGPAFRAVMPEDMAWARENRIPLRILDLRDREEQAKGAVPQAQGVGGKSLKERLDKVRDLIKPAGKKGISVKQEKPATVVLVFPTATEPLPLLERSFMGIPGDIRYMEGGYAAWGARPEKKVSTVGACPTCPSGASGGTK